MWHGIITKVNSAKSLKLHSIFPAFLAKDKHKPLPLVFNRNWTIIFVCQIMELIDYVFGKKALLIKDIIKKVKGTQAFKYALATLILVGPMIQWHFEKWPDDETERFACLLESISQNIPFLKKIIFVSSIFAIVSLQCFNVLKIMLSKVGFSSYNLI